MPLHHILIVDNDPIVALVTQRGLERLLAADVEVTIAPSPGAAWLRCLRNTIDLVIVDPGPQSRSTVALIKALHEERPQVPVLALTAYDTPRLRSQLRSLGVQHYLAKPIELQDLAQTVRTALGMEGPVSTHTLERIGGGAIDTGTLTVH
jgi:DNA-binding NarL/FixJ family response regulator